MTPRAQNRKDVPPPRRLDPGSEDERDQMQLFCFAAPGGNFPFVCVSHANVGGVSDLAAVTPALTVITHHICAPTVLISDGRGPIFTTLL